MIVSGSFDEPTNRYCTPYTFVCPAWEDGGEKITTEDSPGEFVYADAYSPTAYPAGHACHWVSGFDSRIL